MARFNSTSFQVTVPGSGSVNHNEVFGESFMDFHKVKITPDLTGGTFEAEIYERDTFLVANLVYGTNPVSDANYFDPVKRDTAGVETEGNRRFVLGYEDLDATGELHIRVVNNNAAQRIFTVVVEWEEAAVLGPALTAGSVLFASSTGSITEDNANLFWDDTNNILRATGMQTDKFFGGFSIDALAAPGAPTVTPQGTPATTTWGYKITARSSVGETLGSVEGTTTTGAATLNVTDFNRITWAAVAGAVDYQIYRTTAGGTPATTGLIGTVLESATLQLDDTGLAAGAAEPTADSSGDFKLGPMTVGSIPFFGAAGVVLQDNANLFWDDTLNRLGIGTASPATHLHIRDAAAVTGPNITIDSGLVDGSDFMGGVVFRIVGATDVAAIRARERVVDQYALDFQTLAGTLQVRQTIFGNGNVSIGSTSDLARLAVVGSAAGTVGLVVDTAAAPTADAQQWHVNGTSAAVLNVTSTASSFRLVPRDFGNNVAGGRITTHRNSNTGTEGPAAGAFQYIEADSTAQYTWVDLGGSLRIHTAQPTGSSGVPTVPDTAGNRILDDAHAIVTSDVGPHAIGGTTTNNTQLSMPGSFTSGGVAAGARIFQISGTLTGAAGDTSILSLLDVTGSITTQTATESINDVATVRLGEPGITNNLTGSIIDASTLLITGAPTEGTRNNAILVKAGSVRIGAVGTNDGHVHILSPAAGTVGLVVETAASPTTSALELQFGGSNAVRFMVSGIRAETLRNTNFDNGTGVGTYIYLQRNNNASTPAAGHLVITDAGGTDMYIWPDDSAAPGDVRIHTAAPTNANDLAGTVIGTQTSWYKLKQNITEFVDYQSALDAILKTPLYSFDMAGRHYTSSMVIYKKDLGSWFSWNDDLTKQQVPALNDRQVEGYQNASIKVLNQRIEILEAKVKHLGGEL